MGRQSARLWYRGKDHKDIYFQGHYHDKMYLGSTLLWEKLPGDLAIVKAASETNIVYGTAYASRNGRYIYYVKVVNNRFYLYRLDLKTGQKTNCFTFGDIETYYHDFRFVGRNGIGVIYQRLNSHGTLTAYDYIMSANVFVFDMDNDVPFIGAPFSIQAESGYDFGGINTLSNYTGCFGYSGFLFSFRRLYKMDNRNTTKPILITMGVSSGAEWNVYSVHGQTPSGVFPTLNAGISDTEFWAIDTSSTDCYVYDSSDLEDCFITWDQSRSSSIPGSGTKTLSLNETVEEIHNLYYLNGTVLMRKDIVNLNTEYVNNIRTASRVVNVSFDGNYVMYKDSSNSKYYLHDVGSNQTIKIPDASDDWLWTFVNKSPVFETGRTQYTFQERWQTGQIVTVTIDAINADLYTITYTA